MTSSKINEPSIIKISEVVGAINFSVSTKIQSDAALFDCEVTDGWLRESGERHQRAATECAKILSDYIAQTVQQELQEIFSHAAAQFKG